MGRRPGRAAAPGAPGRPAPHRPARPAPAHLVIGSTGRGTRGYVVGMEASEGHPAVRPAHLTGALHATGPDPDLAAPLALFGRFIGAWDIEWRGTDRHGNPATMRATCTSAGSWTGGPSRTSGGCPRPCGPARAAAVPRHHAPLLRPVARGVAVDLDRPAERPGPPVHRPPRGRGHHPRRAGRRASRAPRLPRHHARARPGILPVDREVSTDGRRTWRLDEEMLIRRR